ncbi:MAG TPA: dihydrolipoyl dehydrogenase [Syntrophomonadaceae bacterium]|nr:dihydrolipoyl dehydrogenase [Syntrophomonadaceae bacterium]
MKDLIVIGGGPGGYVAAIRARQLGMDAALVEKDALGGTCLNRGCIPTKAYFQNATVLQTLARLTEYNTKAENISFDLSGARERKNRIVAKLVSGIRDLLKGYRVEVVKGEASIVEPGRILVAGEEITARRILIATGSEPAVPPIPGVGLPGVITSNELLELDEVPRRLAVIGGGVIGIEFACIFNTFGSSVTVFESMPDLLGAMDREIVRRMGVYLKKQKIEVHTQAGIERIEQQGSTLKVVARGKKGTIECEADIVLLATGRKPFTRGLGLERLGISCDRGFISVDENYETSVPGIYAIGDVIKGPMLAHVASEEGIVAVERMTGLNHRVDYDAIPSCVFSFPEIAAVGLSQEEARSRGIDFKVGKFLFAANGKALAMGETDGMVKVIADANDTIIGVHIIGPHASDLIQEASVIVKNKLKVSDVIGTVHPHPTLGEAFLEAVMDVDKRSIHSLPKA